MNDNLFKDTWSERDEQDVQNLQGPILIIGASGFIGAKLFFNLIKRRSDVYAVSRQVENSWRLLQFPNEAAVKNRLNVDITDFSSVQNLLQKIKPRTVFNLSAYGAYERQNQAQRIHDVNYTGTLNLILGLSEIGCDAFVQAGSSSEYGLNCTAPSEDGEVIPNSDYAVSKASAALLIKYYGKIKDFPAVNLRLYSIYGPWEERDRLIPNLIRQGLEKRFPPFANESISRDFVYVDDALRAFVKAALTVCRSQPGLSINIATGRKTSLKDVADTSKKLFEIPASPQFGSMPNRKWDLSNWYGNPTLAEQMMGWKSEIDLEQGLRLTAAWEKDSATLLKVVSPPKDSRKLTAIVACYRDHQAIPIMHERLTKTFVSLGVDYEIIFVNDRSPTSDEDIILEICRKDSHVIGISHSRNFGSQSAFLSGMEIASGDAVILMDGDLQDPPEVIPDLFKKWTEDYDVVYGTRVRREAPIHMQLFYKMFYRVFRTLSDVEIPLDAGDFSLIDRKAFEQMMHLPEKDIFLRGLRAWVGFRQTGVPYVRPERMFGRTTNNFMKNIWWAKKAIFSFSLKPLEYIQRLGVAIFGCSAVLSIYYLIHYLLHPPSDGRGTTTIILLTLGLGGLQLLSLSILGDYLGKVLEEVKNRPRFIRARIFKGYEVISSQEGMAQFIAATQGAISGKYRR